MGKFKIITMIGSMKFYDTMLSEEIILTDKGYIVLHPCKSGYKNIPNKIKDQYDEEIREKIDMANIVYVINKDKYIGKSTLSEIEYAESKNKPIVYYTNKFNILKDPLDSVIKNALRNSFIPPTVTLIGSKRFKNLFNKASKILSLYGFIVHSPAIFQFENYEVDGFSVVQHEVLDKLHKFKMDFSDDILLIDGDVGESSYVGEDTNKELDILNNNRTYVYQMTDNGLEKIIRKYFES